jgi:dihydrofolate reductase
MQVTLFMAASLNGLIARPDYREDFLSRRNWDDFVECARLTGGFIWGRRTHEKFRKYGGQLLASVAGLPKLVVSTDVGFAVEEGFELARSPRDALTLLESKGLTGVTLAGGAALNSSFAREGLIDFIELNVEAVIVGRGIPLFAVDDFDLQLEFAGVTLLTDRIARLRAVVKKG